MCGICGIVYHEPDARASEELVGRMMNVMAHRGPDGEGKYISGQVGLGHRRLAIIDLNTGAQPMTNEDRTLWIVFNGEIYNFRELRAELIAKGHRFSSESDTEVIIHAYEEYGVKCLDRLRGMFAFAIWNERDRTLFVARDRVGIKPLYFTQTANALLFASEIKCLLTNPEVSREVNPQAINNFLAYSYVPGNETLFKNIHKLEPGHYFLLKGGKVFAREYWDLRFETNPQWKNIEEAAEALHELVTKSVRDHMISDVPVGILLSGGVDSTAVLSCARHETGKKIKTFTVGFDGQEFADERPFARLASERFETDHHEISISPGEFLAFLPAYVWHMEEPVCEAPAIALHYISKLARKHVTVLLSGEGGDEAFGGYYTYRNLLLLEQAKSMAGPFKGLLSHCLNGASRINGFGKFKKYAPLIRPQLSEYYFSRASSPFSYFNQNRTGLYSADFLASVREELPAEMVRSLFERVHDRPLLDQMLYIDTKTWLPDDLLIKADKITMANSLELRVPLLDHGVLEFAASLPPLFKVKGSQTKRVFKKAFEDAIPEAILKRKKTGFPVPLRKWLQHDLRDFAHDALLSNRALSRGYFKKAGLEKMLAAVNGNESGPVPADVFSLLTLELWQRQFVDSADPASLAC